MTSLFMKTQHIIRLKANTGTPIFNAGLTSATNKKLDLNFASGFGCQSPE